jgi:hypothetical protein
LPDVVDDEVPASALVGVEAGGGGVVAVDLELGLAVGGVYQFGGEVDYVIVVLEQGEDGLVGAGEGLVGEGAEGVEVGHGRQHVEDVGVDGVVAVVCKCVEGGMLWEDEAVGEGDRVDGVGEVVGAAGGGGLDVLRGPVGEDLREGGVGVGEDGGVVGDGVVGDFAELDGYFEVVVGVEVLVHALLGEELGLEVVAVEVGDGGRDVDGETEDEDG